MKELDFEFPEWYREECEFCQHYYEEIQECSYDGNCVFNKKNYVMEE